MLKFACTYHEAITDDCAMKLHGYELKDDEWKIVEELRDSLKVCLFKLILYFFILLIFIMDIQDSNSGVLQ